MVLLFLFSESIKSLHLQLAYFQRSAERPQEGDRNWCRPLGNFAQKARQTLVFAVRHWGGWGFRFLGKGVAACENHAEPLLSKESSESDLVWISIDFDSLVDEPLISFVCTREFEGIGDRGFPMLHGGDDVGAADPVGLGEIGLRPARGMVGMRVVEADDVFTALAAFALNAHQFPGIDVVAVLGRVSAGVAATSSRGHDARAVVIRAAEQDTAAFVRVGLFAVAAEG